MTYESIIQSIRFLSNNRDFVELHEGDGLRIDLRYASRNNFVGHDMYGPFRQAFLHRIAAAKLSDAFRFLRQEQPTYGFIIYDALRPRSVQRILWEHVRGTENEMYIANPENGSLHNFGFAVDLSIIDGSGQELDMGAGYDDFRPIAQPRLEEKFASDGSLSPAQIENRQILRRAMEKAGFTQLPHEWWHFDAMPRASVREQYQIVE